eukprot:scaffold24073_cov62-Phaeocystis_antarctica.AAC.6
METSVFGCRLPSVSRAITNVSRHSGSASSNLPWVYSSEASVSMKLEAQRIAVPVHALAAAVGCVLPRARAPPLLEAVLVDPLGGAAAGARLHEWALVLLPPAEPARPLPRLRLLCPRRLHLLRLLRLRHLGHRGDRGRGHWHKPWSGGTTGLPGSLQSRLRHGAYRGHHTLG